MIDEQQRARPPPIHRVLAQADSQWVPSNLRADRPLVKELAQRLEDAAVSRWLDEKEVLAGADVRSTLAQALDENCIFLIVLSKASLASSWVQYELELANQSAARGSLVILPVLAGGLKAGEVPEQIRDVIAVDLSHRLGAAFPGLQRANTAHLVAFEQRGSQAAASS